MAYLQIISDDGKDIGRIYIIDGKNVVFDMNENKVGYWIDKVFYDLDMNPVESEEALLLKNK